MRRVWVVILLGLWVGLWVGCSAVVELCQVGEQRSCECLGAYKGVQACQVDGRGWEGCRCDPGGSSVERMVGGDGGVGQDVSRGPDGVGPEGSSCLEGASKACYTGPVQTRGVGVCVAGTTYCVGGRWGPCEGQILPGSESCDGKDNDCDGQVDEDGCGPKVEGCVSWLPSRTIKAHNDGVYGLVFDPNSYRVVTSGAKEPGGGKSLDQNIRLWDARGGDALGEFKGHKDGVHSLAIDPSGKLLASGSTDGSLILWDFAKRTLLHTLTQQKAAVTALAFSPSSTTLATGGYKGDPFVRFWNVTTRDGRPGMTSRRLGFILGLAFHPKAELVASVGDSSVMLWDVPKGLIIQELSGGGSDWSVAFDAGGQLFAYGRFDGTVALHKVSLSNQNAPLAPQPAFLFKGHTKRVARVAFSPDGRILYSASWDNTVRSWDTQSGKLLYSLQTKHAAQLTSMVVHPKGDVLVTGAANGNIKTWKCGK